MSAFDLTARLVRESKSNGKDTILFDKSLTGFGLRIHPSGRKVYIVQARIDRRSRRIVIARYGEMEQSGESGVAFECGMAHDQLMRVLLPYSRNISSVETMMAAEALRGQMTTGTLGFSQT